MVKLTSYRPICCFVFGEHNCRYKRKHAGAVSNENKVEKVLYPGQNIQVLLLSSEVVGTNLLKTILLGQYLRVYVKDEIIQLRFRHMPIG